MSYNAGSAYIGILPDFRDFQKDIKSKMSLYGEEAASAFSDSFRASLTSFTATVTANADTAAATAQLDSAAAARTALFTASEDASSFSRVSSDFDWMARDRAPLFAPSVDDKAATLELDTVARGRTVPLKANVDDTAAKAELAVLTRDRSVKVTVRQVVKNAGNGLLNAAGAPAKAAGPTGLAIGGAVATGASLLPALVPAGVGALFGGLGAVAADQFDKKLQTGLAKTQSVFTSTLSTAVQPLGNMLSSMLPDLDRFITSMGPQLQAAFSASAPYMAEFLTIGEQAVQTLLPAFTQLMNTFAPELPQLGAAFQAISQGIATFLQNLGPGMQAAVTVFTGLATAIGDTLGFLGTLAAGLAMEFADMGHLIGQAFTAIEGAAQATANAVKAGWDIVVNYFKGFPGTIEGIFSGASSFLVGAGKAIISGLDTAAHGAWSTVANWFTSLPGAIRNDFASAGSWLVSAGEAMVRGLISGIESIGGQIESVLLSFVPSPVRGIVSAALGFALPGFAAGTPSAPAGWAWVGEQGPELVRFAGGERVLTNKASMGSVLAAPAMSAVAPARIPSLPVPSLPAAPRLPGVSSPLRGGQLQLGVTYTGPSGDAMAAIVSGLQYHVLAATGGDVQGAIGHGPVRV